MSSDDTSKTSLASCDSGDSSRKQKFDTLCRQLMGSEERMLALVRRFFVLEDLQQVKSRLIGSGFIGGKAVGMLLARAILRADREGGWEHFLEAHDSFFIGTDVFDCFVEHNGWQDIVREQKSESGYLSRASRLRELIPAGDFPPDVRSHFKKMLEYYGQFPVIARSSSLMEDGFGNAFAGKYDSYFCVNQGPLDQRLQQFEGDVRRIYLSAMSEEALHYRLSRGLAGGDERMAILVQRVSGRRHGDYFLPAFAGVGVSYNTFVWNPCIDPNAGMLRMVVGLGTRAVDRVEVDYPRIVSLDKPMLLPMADHEELRRFTQKDVDLLDVSANAIRTISLRELFSKEHRLPVELFGLRDGSSFIITFERLLTRTGFAESMRKMLATLEKAYGYPVDIEFTGNCTDEHSIKVNIVQCRPLQTHGVQTMGVCITPRPDEDSLFRSRGSFMGGSIVQPLQRVISVDPAGYTALSLSDKYEVARIVGRLNRTIPSREELPTLLMGPGRWGTTTPTLGVPVRFAEFSAVAVLAEVAFSAGGADARAFLRLPLFSGPRGVGHILCRPVPGAENLFPELRADGGAPEPPGGVAAGRWTIRCCDQGRGPAGGIYAPRRYRHSGCGMLPRRNLAPGVRGRLCASGSRRNRSPPVFLAWMRSSAGFVRGTTLSGESTASTISAPMSVHSYRARSLPADGSSTCDLPHTSRWSMAPKG